MRQRPEQGQPTPPQASPQRDRVIRGEREFKEKIKGSNGYDNITPNELYEWLTSKVMNDFTQDDFNEWVTRQIIRMSLEQSRDEDKKPIPQKGIFGKSKPVKQPYEEMYDETKQKPRKEKPSTKKTVWIGIALLLTLVAIYYWWQIIINGMTISF